MVARLLTIFPIELRRSTVILTFCLLISPICSAQLSILRHLKGPDNHSEIAYTSVECSDHYYIPVVAWFYQQNYQEFYILKLDQNGKIDDRKLFHNWDEDRGSLFSTSNESIWKNSVAITEDQSSFQFVLTEFDANLGLIQKLKIEPSFPKKCLLEANNIEAVELEDNGLFFMLDVMAFGWGPGTKEVYGTNMVYISRSGKLMTNVTDSSFRSYNRNWVWQYSDSSVIAVVRDNDCSCTQIKEIGLEGSVIRDIHLNRGAISKKSGDFYYGLWEENRTSYFGQYDSEFKLVKLKEFSEEMRPRQFWDVRDNTDLRMRVRVQARDSNGRLTNDHYSTIIDTSFTEQDIKWFTNSSDDVFQGQYDSLSERKYFPTKDGGAFLTIEKIITPNDDWDLIIAKLDTVEPATNKQTNWAKVYPNPNNGDRLMICSDDWKQVNIYDCQGRFVGKHLNEPLIYTNSVQLDQLIPGQYFIHVILENESYYEKLIIIRQ